MNTKHLIQLVLVICAAAVVAPNPASAQQKAEIHWLSDRPADLLT